MFKIILKVGYYLTLIAVILIADRGQAETNTRPDMMVGQTTVTNGTDVYYGGMAGNFAILNSQIKDDYGLDSRTLPLSGGCQGAPLTTPICFIFGNYKAGPNSFFSQADRMLTSRTSITNNGETEAYLDTPALFFGNRNIIGDTSTGISLNNFAFWGRNLAQTGGSLGASGAVWALNNYSINNSSQSVWDNTTATSEFNKFNEKIELLRNGGTTITSPQLYGATTNINWHLQDSTSAIMVANAGPDRATYPEGRVWVVNAPSVVIPAGRNITFDGVGTIIFTGNLTISNNVKILPNNKASDRLGIIVYGNMTLNGNNNLNMMSFCKNNFITANNDNFDLQGSYVAQRFQINSGSDNVKFNYDYNSEGRIPPGFRYLNIPGAKEIGNAP